MATIHKEIPIAAQADDVWDAFRDIGSVHTRLAPDFVSDCHMEGEERVVTFRNGFVSRETIVTLDDETRRLAYAAEAGEATHYAASFQVFDDGKGATRVVWIVDLLPNELKEPISAMVDEGARAMQKHLERARR